MVVDLSWLSFTVPVPVWGILTLAGFQYATRAVRDVRDGRRRRRREARRKASRGGRR